MRRRSYVPGKEPRAGKEQLPPWQPAGPTNGIRSETDSGPAASGISIPGQRQLRSRPAFAPQLDPVPPLGADPQSAVADDQSGADQSTPKTSGGSLRTLLAGWWSRFSSVFKSPTGPEALSPGVDAPSADGEAKGQTSLSGAIGDVYPAASEALLPAWLAPSAEPVDPPLWQGDKPDSTGSRSDDPPAVTRERRQRIDWTPLQAFLDSRRIQLISGLSTLLASWRRWQEALRTGLLQWRAARKLRQSQSRAARARRRQPAAGAEKQKMSAGRAATPETMVAPPPSTVPSSQLPGAPVPKSGEPDPVEASPLADRLQALRQWLRAAAAAIGQPFAAASRAAYRFLRRRARILVPVAILLAVLFLAGRSTRIRRMLDPDPPLVEVLVAGPVIRDALNDTLKVPLRIVLDDEDLDSIDDQLMDEVQISYGETDELTQSPLAVQTVDDSGEPLTRVVEVTLPGTLAGQQVMLQAATSRRQDQVRLSFASPPAFEIRSFGSDSAEQYDEQGQLRLELDGSIKDDDGRYDYEWLVTTLDASGHTNSFSLGESKGELLVTVDASLACNEYTVTLLARSDGGSVSWSQERRACRLP